MSAGRIANQMRMQALLAMGKLGAPKYGLVSSYNPQTYEVKVTLQPEVIETGWIPIVSLLAGSAFGVYAAPSQGDQAVVCFQEGDKEAGFCVGFLNSINVVPPPVQSGEVHLIAKPGQFVKLLQDGTIDAQADANTTLTLTPGGNITSKGTWNHTGTFTATGEGTFNGGHTVSQHTHTQPADSHGDTEQPTNKPTG